jgi:hypothetical protein
MIDNIIHMPESAADRFKQERDTYYSFWIMEKKRADMLRGALWAVLSTLPNKEAVVSEEIISMYNTSCKIKNTPCVGSPGVVFSAEHENKINNT